MPEESTYSKDESTQLPPPQGDETKAGKYIERLVQLLGQDKVTVIHTDLTRFDPSALEDHYRIDLQDYEIEVSHSKQPSTGKDSYVILFTNVKNIRDGCSEKLILAYMHLSDDQFHAFKRAANDQMEQIRKKEEDKRFVAAMQPIDRVLNQIGGGNNNQNSGPTPPRENRNYEQQTSPEVTGTIVQSQPQVDDIPPY